MPWTALLLAWLHRSGFLQSFQNYLGADVPLFCQLVGFGHDGFELLLNFLGCLKRRLLRALHGAEFASLDPELRHLKTEVACPG